MFTRYKDTATGAIKEGITMGRQFATSTWQTGFFYYRPNVMDPGFQYEVQQMAFFADVKLMNGKVSRYWQSRHGADYGWNDAFSLPTTLQYIPYGSVKYASPASQIFDAKHACGK